MQRLGSHVDLRYIKGKGIHIHIHIHIHTMNLIVYNKGADMFEGNAMNIVGATELVDTTTLDSMRGRKGNNRATWESGPRRGRSINLHTAKWGAMSPAAEAGRTSLQRRGPNSFGNWRRLQQRPFASMCNECAININDRIAVTGNSSMARETREYVIQVNNVGASSRKDEPPS